MSASLVIKSLKELCNLIREFSVVPGNSVCEKGDMNLPNQPGAVTYEQTS